MTSPAARHSGAHERRPLHAVITGATGGLGRAIAARLGADGVALTLLARDAAQLEQLAHGLRRRASGAIETLTCELANADALASAARSLLDRRRLPDVLVNNAAVQGPIGRFDAVDWQAWRRTIEVDLLAPARLCQLLAPAMVESGWGRIINISGGGAAAPRPHFSAYAVAKSALVRFTETLAVELADSGVTVNAVAPGAMNTRMVDEVVEAGPGGSGEYFAAVARRTAGGHAPDAAVALIAWLASPASDGITGRLISAVWDPWETLAARREELAGSDIYTLRRIVPKDRGKSWGER